MLGPTRILGFEEIRVGPGPSSWVASTIIMVPPTTRKHRGAADLGHQVGPAAVRRPPRCRAQCSHSLSSPQAPEGWNFFHPDTHEAPGPGSGQGVGKASCPQTVSPSHSLPPSHAFSPGSSHDAPFCASASQVPEDSMGPLRTSHRFWECMGEILFSYFCASSNSKDESLDYPGTSGSHLGLTRFCLPCEGKLLVGLIYVRFTL